MKHLRIPKAGTHSTASRLISGEVNVSLIGAGGNGSQMLSGLARLHMALLRIGHSGLRVTVWDFDKVSESNVGRQLFFPADVGQMKSFVLVNRYNLAYGLGWRAEGDEYECDGRDHLVISCVDSAKSRRSIRSTFWDKSRKTPSYWLDLGNKRQTGQVILGEPKGSMSIGVSDAESMRKKGVWDIDAEFDKLRLPCVTDVFPDLLDESIPEDDTPSCSLAEALMKQDLFINQHVSSWALQLLWKLFREGKIQYHGAFIDLESGRVNPLPVPSHIKPRRLK